MLAELPWCIMHPMHPLDRPAWASLSTAHRALAVGDDLALCYLPGINLFASARDDSDAALARLVQLIEAGAQGIILQAPPIKLPPGLVARKTAMGVQMVALQPLTACTDAAAPPIVPLDLADAEEMLALATLTEPGPFLRETGRMGRFVGIRIDGRLVAMAGERFRFPGHTEVSGVCTHPDFRGRGLAQHLSRHVAARIAARGDTAFLHSWASNTAAIALYQKLGFTLRGEVNVAVVEPR